MAPRLKALLWLILASALISHAQAQASNAPTLSARLDEMLARLSSGHSPSPEEIASVQTLDPMPSPQDVRAALPSLKKALDNPDPAMRGFALTLLNALKTAPTAPAAGTEPVPADSSTDASKPTAAPRQTTTPNPSGAQNGSPGFASGFRPDTARALTPAVAQIAARLADDEMANRVLAANALGGFAPDPPPSVYAPLFAYLKRDDGIGPTGSAVVDDLLSFTPISNETASAISSYVRRSDQSADARSNLVDAIASKPQQNQQIDQTLLTYLASDDNSLRARVILSLPQLDLAPEVFTDSKARVAQLAALDAASGQENLQVVNAAKAVTTCWTQVKMTSGCPVY